MVHSYLKPSKLKGGSVKARPEHELYRMRELSTDMYQNTKLKRLEQIKLLNGILKTKPTQKISQ